MSKTKMIILTSLAATAAMMLTTWAIDGFNSYTTKEFGKALLKALGFAVPFAIILSMFMKPKK